ncbi:MAG: hypothetical protein RL213_1605 [Bacteroidota bacterium]|jgi:hypothetical protein
MFQQSKETNYLESTSILVQVFRWRKPLTILTVSAAILSFVFSGPAFITPKYRSSLVFFPPATNSVSKALLEENISEQSDFLAFGAETQAEQMLQLLNSDAIREAVIRKFDLARHYGIDTREEYPTSRLYEQYRDNISFSRTEFMSVRIDVLDTDPQLAADIANEIASRLDSTMNTLRRNRAVEAVGILERAYENKSSAIRTKEDSLRKIREGGVMDYLTQSAVYNEQYAKAYSTYNQEKASLSVLEKAGNVAGIDTAILRTRARIEAAGAGVSAIRFKLDQLAALGGSSIALNEELEADRKELSRMRQQLDRLKVDTEQGLSNKFIVNTATKAERKSTPVRWLIVLTFTLGTFIAAFMTLLMLDRLKGQEF